MKKIEPLFKYQSLIYDFQRTSDVDHRGMKIRWSNKLFPLLNVINGKKSPCGSKGVIIYYHYRSDPKLGTGVVVIRIILFSCHACTTISYISWDSKIK